MTVISDTKSTALVVEFSFFEGGLTTLTLNQDNRFTNLESTIVNFPIGEPDATPDPALKLSVLEFTSGMKEPSANLTMSDSWPLITKMRREYSLPQIKCRIYEYTFDTSAGITNVTTEQANFIEGECVQIRSALGGKKGIVEIEINNLKQRTKKASGVVVTPQCGWTYGDAKTCKDDPTAHYDTGNLNTISQNGYQVNVTGMAAQDPGWWIAGFIFYNGVPFRIRDWDSVTNEFLLSQRVSYELSQATLPVVVDIAAGCRLTLADCRDFDNEINFNGLGIKLPAHHPLYEFGNG